MRLCTWGVAALLLGVAGTAGGSSSMLTITGAMISNFDPAGPGMIENPFVAGHMSIVSVEEAPGLVDTQVTGLFVRLKPFTTYDLRIVNADESFGVGLPDAITTGFMGLAMVQFTIEDAPMALTVCPVVDVFIDEDEDLLDVSPTEARAAGSACP